MKKAFWSEGLRWRVQYAQRVRENGAQASSKTVAHLLLDSELKARKGQHTMHPLDIMGWWGLKAMAVLSILL